MTTETELLTGRISSIDYAAGTACVVYADRDNAVSAPIPFLAAEYQMPAVGQLVHVLQTGARRLILGRAWSDANRPPASGEGVYHKAFDAAGRAALHYDAATGALELRAPLLQLAETGSGGDSSLGALLARMAAIEARLAAAEAELAAHGARIDANETEIAAHEQRISALGG